MKVVLTFAFPSLDCLNEWEQAQVFQINKNLPKINFSIEHLDDTLENPTARLWFKSDKRYSFITRFTKSNATYTIEVLNNDTGVRIESTYCIYDIGFTDFSIVTLD